MAVARRLHSGLLRSLFTAARQNQETVPQDDTKTDLTWVNLVKYALETEPPVLPFDPPANPRNRPRNGGDGTPLSVRLSLRTLPLDPYQPTEGWRIKSNDLQSHPSDLGKPIGVRAIADQIFRTLASTAQGKPR